MVAKRRLFPIAPEHSRAIEFLSALLSLTKALEASHKATDPQVLLGGRSHDRMAT